MKPGRCSLHQLLISNSALLPLLWSPHFFSLLQESCKTRGDLSHLQPSKESGTTFSCSKATSISWSPWWQQPLLSCFAPASSNHSGRERLPPNCPPRIPFSQLCQGSTEQIRLSFIPNVVYLKKKKKTYFPQPPGLKGETGRRARSHPRHREVHVWLPEAETGPRPVCTIISRQISPLELAKTGPSIHCPGKVASGTRHADGAWDELMAAVLCSWGLAPQLGEISHGGAAVPLER